MGRYRLRANPFNHIKAADLESNVALDALLDHAIQKDWWADNEAARLDFYALAERALRVGNDPGKVFATCIKRKLTNNITRQDEERGRRRVQGQY